MFRRDAHTPVAYANLDIRSTISGSYDNLASGRCMCNGIIDEIAQHLPHALRVSLDGRQFRHFCFDAQAPFRGNRLYSLYCFPDNLAHIDGTEDKLELT